MALQVWLPLNGSIENKGISTNYIIPNTNYAAWANEGKIGSKSLYPTTTTSGVLSYNGALSNAQSYTICAWIKSIDTSSTPKYIVWTGSDSNGLGFGLRSASNGTIVLFLMFGTAINATVGLNEWHHVAMAINYELLKFSAYLDGTFVNEANYTQKTCSTNTFSVGWLRPSYYPFKGYINDVRVYDTCLSAKEVKDISKGLVLHYPLDEVSIENSSPLPLRVPSGKSLYDTTIYTENDGSKWLRIFHHNKPASYIFSSSNNFEDYVHIDSNRWFDLSYCYWLNSWEFMIKQKAESKTATESKYRWIQTKNPMTAVYADVAAANVTKITTSGYTSFSNGGLYHHGSNTYLCANNGSDGNWWGAIGAWKRHQNGIPAWAGVVVKSGYTDLYIRIDSLLSSIAYDSSGYCNHGSIIGTLTTDTSTPRYTASTVFNEGNNHVASPSIGKEGFKNSFTVSWWSKTSNMNGKMAWGSSDNGLNLYPSESYFCWNTGDGAVNTIGTVTWATYNDGNWHHYVMTGDGTTGKLYIDGEHKGNAKTYKPLSSPIIYVSGWSTASSYVWNGNISDFRIYCTALSEDDVKELYNTSAFVTNNGVFAEYELYEDNLSDVKKTGLLETADFYENGAESGYSLDTDKTRVASNYIISEEFIEI